MSEERLYEQARQRIDRNNRRWLVWSVNFIGFLLYVGVLATYSGIPRNVGETLLQAWFGALVLHTTAIVLMQNEEAGIEGEIAKLRKTLFAKPKRDDQPGLSASVETSKSQSRKKIESRLC